MQQYLTSTPHHLFIIARQAAQNYKTLYGEYPEKIGVHVDKLQFIGIREIVFPALSTPFTFGDYTGEIPRMIIHHCKVVPVYGCDPEQVYIRLPGLPGMKSSDGLARMVASEYDVIRCNAI